MFSIYCHIFPNKKRYIGITKTSLQKRWNNGNGYKTCALVDRAIKKYGWENIDHEVLCLTETIQEAEEKERYYISLYKSDDPKYGYNILPGGNVATNEVTETMRYKLGNGWRGKKRSEEEKKKIGNGVKKTFQRPESNGHIGLKASDEAKQKMASSQKASWENNEQRRESASRRMKERMSNPEYRQKVLDALKANKPKKYRKLTDEERERLRELMKGRFIGEKSICSKPVAQYDKNGTLIRVWANAGEAERAGIAKRQNISKVCHKVPHYLTAGGYVWRFYEAT